MENAGPIQFFLVRAIETAICFSPADRRLVVQPFHQSIYFSGRPALRPDGTWELRAEFKYLPLNEALPSGWFEGLELLDELNALGRKNN